MNDMGRFVLCIERFCRLRIAEKGHGQINTVKLLKKTTVVVGWKCSYRRSASLERAKIQVSPSRGPKREFWGSVARTCWIALPTRP
jgi:hypothetical protein